MVAWIGVRPRREAALLEVDAVLALAGTGLEGDHYGAPGGSRQVTLIQAEHLPVLAALLGRAAVHPGELRRNLVVRGINLLALKGHRFRAGEALLEVTGACAPCSRMEAALGPGGWNAMRGHGGITARIVESGRVSVGSLVAPQEVDPA